MKGAPYYCCFILCFAFLNNCSRSIARKASSFANGACELYEMLIIEEREIGRNNKLLVSIPDDMKFFRETTTGKVVVMGRKTLESFPGKKPLKNRVNIVLTGDRSYQADGAVIVHDMEELHEELKKYPSEDIYVIGGESIYKQLLDECDVAHITKIDFAYEADAWFPNLDEKEAWVVTADSEEQTYFDLEYHFYKYEKKA